MSNYCTSDKKVCIKAVNNSQFVNITFDADATIGYGAFGTGSVMDGSDMIIIWNIDNKVAISNRKGIGHDIGTQTNDWNILNTAVANNRMTAQLSRLMVQPGKPTIMTVNSFIWCWGLDKISSLDANAAVPYHDLSGTFKMNIQSGEITELENASSDMQIAHGVLMCLAWFVLIPASVLLTRFFKDKFPNWMKFHIGLNSLAALFMTIALILIIVDRNGIIFLGKMDPHSIFGICIFILMFAQGALGVYIDKTFNSRRKEIPVRDKAHWYVGYLTMFLSLVNVFLGMKTTISKIYGYVFVAIFGIYLLAWIILTIKFGRVHEKSTEPTGILDGSSSSAATKNNVEDSGEKIE